MKKYILSCAVCSIVIGLLVFSLTNLYYTNKISTINTECNRRIDEYRSMVSDLTVQNKEEYGKTTDNDINGEANVSIEYKGHKYSFGLGKN